MEEFFKLMIKEFCDKDQESFGTTISDEVRANILKEMMEDEDIKDTLTNDMRDVIFETEAYQNTMEEDE